MLPREWCRGPQWASTAARAEWEPILRSAQAAWEELEPASITEGVRDSALLHLMPEELVRASADCASAGLEVTPLAAEGAHVRAAVHRPGLGTAWRAAWGDDDAVGQLLGFPSCCRLFFKHAWADAQSSDVTRAMRTVEGPWEANTMLRWLGVRLVPHLPCSADCPATVDLARRYYQAGLRAGVDVRALESLLRLPVTYSALGGVAIVETPHFRFMAGTDPTENEERLSRAAAEPASWEDNGFTSADAMASAHAVVVGAVHSAAVVASSVLDLGAGDGALLDRCGQPGAKRVGVESDPARVARGSARHAAVELRRGKIQDVRLWAERGVYDLALLMPGRLLEMAPGDAAAVRSGLSHSAARLLVYAYGDVLVKHGGLGSLARSAAVRLTTEVQVGPGAAAAGGKFL